MARGWESKGVEAQQADKEAKAADGTEPLSPEAAALAARRKTLEMARARAQADLARATHPSHQAMLEEALRTLQQQLEALPPKSS